jgi:hypothetical protein
MYGQQNPYSQYPYTGYAYPNYGRQNFMQPQQQQMAQPQPQMQQQQPMQPVMPTLCYAKMEEAKPYIITAPNSSMLFIDREKSKALLKTTDNVCNSYPRYFNIIETDENGNDLQAQKQEVAPQVDYSKFVTVEQLNGLPTAEQYKELVAQYTSLLDQVNTMKKIIATVNSPKSNEKVVGKGNAQANG